MDTTRNAVERAFQVAVSCTTIPEVARTLKHEGFVQVDAHLAGRAIRRELKVMLRAAG